MQLKALELVKKAASDPTFKIGVDHIIDEDIDCAGCGLFPFASDTDPMITDEGLAVCHEGCFEAHYHKLEGYNWSSVDEVIQSIRDSSDE